MSVLIIASPVPTDLRHSNGSDKRIFKLFYGEKFANPVVLRSRNEVDGTSVPGYIIDVSIQPEIDDCLGKPKRVLGVDVCSLRYLGKVDGDHDIHFGE